MRPKHLVALFALPVVFLAALLMLAAPATPAHAGGVVSVCDEAHLRAALAGGGTVTFSCSGTITLTATIRILADTTIDGTGQSCHHQRQPRSARVHCGLGSDAQPE